jgi:hypothetical protein
MQLRVPNDAFIQLRLRDCAELCAQMDGSDEVQGFITPHATFETLLQSLINHEYWFDAVSLLAHAMPPRSSIWWAAIVCDERLKLEDTKDPLVIAQVQTTTLAKQWVVTPEEDIRQAVHRATTRLKNSLPAHWVGMAVFWATGNITPEAGVVTPPPPYLYARGVSAALDLCASLAGEHRLAVFEDAILRGMDIAAGGSGDTAAVAAAAAKEAG